MLRKEVQRSCPFLPSESCPEIMINGIDTYGDCYVPWNNRTTHTALGAVKVIVYPVAMRFRAVIQLVQKRKIDLLESRPIQLI